ncbi:hypothetical protein ACLHZU_19855, partial [Aeromonas salmonicida]|uniref:hypothetical protein n=1 Tax=Aeromonas salmonicida TaxID=645 RepID=UPI003D008425
PASQGSWLIRLACSAVLVGAHYREPRWDDKGFFITIVHSLRYAANPCLFAQNPINPSFDWI